jgi:hypothetical protein
VVLEQVQILDGLLAYEALVRPIRIHIMLIHVMLQVVLVRHDLAALRAHVRLPIRVLVLTVKVSHVGLVGATVLESLVALLAPERLKLVVGVQMIQKIAANNVPLITANEEASLVRVVRPEVTRHLLECVKRNIAVVALDFDQLLDPLLPDRVICRMAPPQWIPIEY